MVHSASIRTTIPYFKHNTLEHYAQYAHIVENAGQTHNALMKDEKLTKRVQFLAKPSMVKEIEDYRYKHRLRTQGETIRHLIELGLQAKPKKK